MKKKLLVLLMCAAFICLEFAGTSMAASWPTRPVSIIVPAGAGGASDLIARVLAEKLTKKLGQAFVVVNVTGAGGSSGISQVHDAAPDGNTILCFHNALLINKVTGISSYSFDGFEVGPHIVRDGATGFYVSSKAPYKTYKELIDYCKQHPGEVVMGTEVGGFTFLITKSFEKTTGVQFNIVDVGSNAAKCTALLGGHIDVMPNQYLTCEGYIKSGDFIALGFPFKERNAIYPDVPTALEGGVDWEFPAYEYGFFFPKGTPQEILDIFNTTIKEMYDNNEIQDDLIKIGAEPVYMTPDDYKKVLNNIETEYTELWASVTNAK